MAAKLQCEICGGKLIGKPGGIFECDSCGTEYSTEWAKAKIQEIRGTVKVEGTVEVQGKVQVEGPVKVEGAANKDSLLKRGYLALEDGDWSAARGFFNDALNADAECAEAYLGLTMAEGEFCNRDAFAAQYVLARSTLSDKKNIAYARRFADEALKTWLDRLDSEKERNMEQARKISEKNRIRLEPVRKRIACAKGMISAGSENTVGVEASGKEIICGAISGGWDWTNIKAVAASKHLTIGLDFDGTVKAAGYNTFGECSVDGLRDAVAVAAGGSHAVVVKSDGTVVAKGSNSYGQCEVDDWREIVSAAAGEKHTVGLKRDGTVVAVGAGAYDQCNVGKWRGIVEVAAGENYTAGLKSDGTVVGTGWCFEREVINWEDIIAIAAGNAFIVGLKADGTVVAVGRNYYGELNVGEWRDIVAIAAGEHHTVGVKSDGTVVATGYSTNDSRCYVDGWKLFNSIDTLEQERKNYIAQAEWKRKNDAIRAEKKRQYNEERISLKNELPTLKGIFSGKRRKEIEARLAQIEAELKRLGS